MTTDEKLDSIMATLASIEKRLGSGNRPAVSSSAAVEPSDDKDLDSEHGNPKIKKDPPRWKGDSCVGKTLSQCPAEFLEVYAGFKSWQAGKDESSGDEADKKKAWYSRRDAARALGWKARIEGGYKPSDTGNEFIGDDDIPF